jgi:C-terminal processing protease CtpA/Prc
MTVQKVFPEGPAEGVLQVDDHIALVNGINTISMTYNMLLELLQRIPRGDYVTFTVLRPDRDDTHSMRSESKGEVRDEGHV